MKLLQTNFYLSFNHLRHAVHFSEALGKRKLNRFVIGRKKSDTVILSPRNRRQRYSDNRITL